MSHPALVIFDMAGTTVEDKGQVPDAFAAALAAHGIIVTPEDITRVRGASKRQAIRSLLPPSEAGRADLIYAAFCDELSRRYRYEVASIPGAEDVFGDLRTKGSKVALTTGFDREIALLLMSSLRWTRTTIDALVCGDDVANGRPAPDMILLAMKMTGIDDPARVANVGDTTLDLESAARAGVHWNIGVLSGAHPREALEKAPHTHIIQSITNLAEVLGA
jgi:phosphonatase-like hydrolase